MKSEAPPQQLDGAIPNERNSSLSADRAADQRAAESELAGETVRFLESIADPAERAKVAARVRQLVTAQLPPETASAEARAVEGQRVDAIGAAIFADAPSVWDDDIGAAREAIPGGRDLLVRGVATYFFGGRGSGKSTVADTLGWSVAMEGTGVLVLDRENGPALSRERLEDALRFNPDAFNEPRLREFYEHRHWPEFSKAWEPEDYADAIAGRGYGVVVYDSVRELLRQLRLSSNSEDDWSELYDLLATPLIKRGITPVFLDNVGHKATERPKGTGAKMDAAPQGYRVWARHTFSPEITGVIGIEAVRSRLGDIGREWRMTVGGGYWGVPDESTESTTPATWDRILAALEDHEWHEQGALANQLEISKDTVRRLVNVELAAARKEDRKASVEREERAGEPTRIRRRGAGLEI